jgi:glycosyltransferase involved in cell wall biosynthesis
MKYPMDFPTISVVVPNWNDSRYIETCLESIFQQTIPPDEIIVVDDCSTDNSVELINGLIKDKPYARLIRNVENLGVNGAINVGLRDVQSEFVLFLASNDYVKPGIFLKAKKSLIQNRDVGLWSAMIWLVDEFGHSLGMHRSPVVSINDRRFPPSECLKLAMKHGNWFTGPTMIFNTNKLRLMGGFDPTLRGLSDLIVALRLACKYGAVFSPAPYGVTRVHAGGVLSESLSDSLWLEQTINYLSENGPELQPELFKAEFLNRLTYRLSFSSFRYRHNGIAQRDATQHYKGFRKFTFNCLIKICPARTTILSDLAAFCILRPFDILPFFWYRLIGSMFIRIRFSRFCYL